MNSKTIIITAFLIFIPLILLVLCYRSYVYNYCQNDMKCLKKKLIFNLNNLNYKLTNIKNEENKKEIENTKNNDDNIEGFFGGLGSWFSGSAPTNLPVSPGIVSNENLPTLEQKINDKMKNSKQFPPTDDIEFKDSNNSDLLNNLNSNSLLKNQNQNQNQNQKNEKPVVLPKPPSIVQKKQNLKDMLGTCQFYNDRCPDKYYQLGNFSIQGNGSNSILTCGNVQNTKPAHAVAIIKNHKIDEIHITDQGHGFNPSNPPKIKIEGGKGNDATAEAIVDDDGFLKLIKVTNPGYNYNETPNVLIDAPFMNSSCHLCCKDDS